MPGKSGSEKRVLADKITLRVDPNLMDRIRFSAEREAMSPSSWLRIVAAAAAGDDVKAMPRKPTPQPKPKVFRPSVDAPELTPFLGDLRRIGININQISLELYRANASNIGLAQTLKNLQQAQDELRELLQDVKSRIQGGSDDN